MWQDYEHDLILDNFDSFMYVSYVNSIIRQVI